MAKVFSISAEVHKEVGAGYRVKTSLLDLGVYINGMMVFPPDDEHDWSVYPPALRVFRNYKYLIEFNKKMPLWCEINDECIEAVKRWQSEDHSDEDGLMRVRPNELETVSGYRDDSPIRLEDIGF